MAEVIGIIGSVVGILTAAEVAYNKIKSMKGLPEAFTEVALRVPLAQQILSDIHSRSRDAPESTIRVLLPVINSCKGNAEALKTTLEKLDSGDSTTAWSLDKYISLIKSRGKKGRVEDLMKKILQDIYTLASHKTINAATSEQLEELKEAVEFVGKAKQSAPDEMLEDFGNVSISHGGQGPMLNQVGDHNTTWNNFGSGHINNISGDAHIGLTPGQRRREAFRHLDCASYEDHKNRNPAAIHNTCKWFTEHPTNRSWMISLDERFLWVSADPGCGKSVLARHLIDHELKASRVIYFFFKDGFDDQDNAESALKCLLHQLLKDNPHLFTDEILELLEEMGEKRSKGFSSLWNIFAKVSYDVVDTICVMDALDECEASGWSRMARALGDLCGTGMMGMRFILFSRPHNQVRTAIRQGRMAHINLRGEDPAEIDKISAEIDIVVRRKVADLVLESKLSFDEEEKVLQRLTKESNRTYLWVHVVCDMLQSLERVEKDSLERFLDRLPETVEDAYEKILCQSVDAQAAKTLLHIIVAAARPMSVEEMATAMAVNGHQSYEGEFSVMGTDSFVEGMRNICGFLVVVVKKNVHLIHQSAREFLIRDSKSGRDLQWEACLNWEESNRIIARICIWYLLNIGSPRPSSSEPTTQARLNYARCHGIFYYASRYWASHYRQSKMEENSDVAHEVALLCNTEWPGFRNWYNYFGKFQDRQTLWFLRSRLGLASFFGIGHVVTQILGESKYSLYATRGSRFRFALHCAATGGSHNVVMILLETRSKQSTFIDHGRLNIGPALNAASRMGHDFIVAILLQATRTKFSPEDALSALSIAAHKGHNSVVQFLLKSEIDYATRTSWRSKRPSRMVRFYIRYPPPLHAALRGGHLAAVKIILESGKINPDSVDEDGYTPLFLASHFGNTDAVKMLLETDQVDVNSRDQRGGTPLSEAVERGHIHTVKLLLETSKVDVNSQDQKGKTPLLKAVERGHIHTIKLLLETSKVDVNSQDQKGETPLLKAVERGDIHTIKLLLETGKVDVNIRDRQGQTAFSLAVERGNLEVLVLLQATGKVDTSLLNEADKTHLSVAVEKNLVDVVSWLLTVRDIYEKQLSPRLLWTAVANDNFSIVKLLLSAETAALFNTKSDTLTENPVMVAFKRGSHRYLRCLLDARPMDANREFNWVTPGNMRRATLLMRATEKCQLDIVETLLSRKADVNLKSSVDGATAFSTAVTLGQLDVIKRLLRVEGLDLSVRCEGGLTARLIARKLHDRYGPRSSSGLRFREIILLLNEYALSMPDGGEALQNLERSIIEDGKKSRCKF